MRWEDKKAIIRIAAPKIIIHHERLIVNIIMIKNPNTNATKELREKVKRRAAMKTLKEAICHSLTFSISICAIIKSAKNANNPPKRLGSNQVDKSRPMCGSQPAGVIEEKSGKIIN